MKKIVGILFALIVSVLAMGAVPVNTYAANSFNQKACSEATEEDQKAALGCNDNRSAPSVVNSLFDVVIVVTGIAAVIVIVFGGQRYIVANGDASKLAMAKSMILYGVVGLIVASVAYAIVNFVLKGVFS